MAAKKTSKKTSKKAAVAVVSKSTTAVAVCEDAYDYGETAGAGLRDISRDELAIPFLTIAQSSSKTVKDPDHAAQAGQIINSVSGELIDAARKDDEGALFVPAFMTRAWVEWTDDNKFVGIRSTRKVPSDDEELTGVIENAKKFGENILKNGNNVVYTVYLNGFCLENVGDNFGSFAMLPFKSTQHKHLKPLLTMLTTHMVSVGPPGQQRRINPPMFANQIRIKTKLETHAKGDAFGYDITFAVDNDIKASLLPARVDGVLNPLFQMAIDFENSFSTEDLAASAAKAGNEAGPEASEGFSNKF